MIHVNKLLFIRSIVMMKDGKILKNVLIDRTHVVCKKSEYYFENFIGRILRNLRTTIKLVNVYAMIV